MKVARVTEYVRRLFLACAVVLWAAGAASSQSASRPADAAAAEFDEMLRMFAGVGSRAPGMPGNKALEDLVARRFKASGLAWGELSFRVPVFVPGQTTITPAGGQAAELQAMHPTLMRPGNFLQDRLTTILVYLGRGEHADLERVAGSDLNGAIALMDFDCGDRWLDLLRHGIRGFVFVGADSYQYHDSYTKVYNTEAAVPRYFVSRDDGARLKEACRDGPVAAEVVQAAPSRWRIETLRDLWVIVPGTDPELSKDIIMVTAALDANSVVPERAVGAQSAGNLYLLLKLLEEYKARPAPRSVMLVAVNAHTHSFLGERILAWHLLANANAVEDVRYALARDMRIMRLYTSNYSLLRLEPVEMDAGELNAWVDLLWQLDEKQHARQAQAEGEQEADESPQTRPAGLSEEYFAEDGQKETRESLDLEKFTDGDFREAVDGAIGELREKKEGFFFRLTADDETVREVDEDIQRLEALKKLSHEEMRRRAEQAKTVFLDEKLLESWRAKLDGSTGVRLPIKGELQNEAKRRLNRLKMRMLALAKNAQMDPKLRSELLARMDKQKRDMTRVLVLFNKIDVGIGRSRVRYRQIAADEAQRELLKDYRDKLVADFAQRGTTLARALRTDWQNGSIREALEGSQVKMVFCLDLDYRNDRIGFCSASTRIMTNWEIEMGKALADLAEKVEGEQDGGRGTFVDAMSRVGGHRQSYYFHSTDSPVPCFHAGGATPAVAVRNAFSSPGSAFSPEEAENAFKTLDRQRFFRLHEWMRRYLRALAEDKDFTTAESYVRPATKTPFWSTVLRTFTLDQFSGKIVPDKPIPGSLIALYPADGKTVLPPLVSGDVVNCYRVMSDETGTTVLYGVGEGGTLAPIAYQMDDDFRTLLYDIDKGQVQESKQLSSNVQRQESRTLPMFECVEFTIYDRTDPTLIADKPITIQKLWPTSAETRASPQKYGTHGIASLSMALSHLSKGPVSVTIARKDKEYQQERLIVITDQKRCVLNATDAQPEGVGFASAEELGADFFAHAARDMDAMNRKRLREMKGVSNELVTDFLKEGKQALEEMNRAQASHDHNDFVLASYKALGREVKAYEQIRGMNADMLKAVVLYMALMVPFCFFLQKLLFNFTRLELNMLAFVLMFSATYVVFRLIHPAFRIAINPEAIFIAFILGAVGCFVTWILHKRFKTEMQLLFRNYTGMAPSVGYTTVGQTAMMIGVNNMRRRRIRTSLTTGTIVLVVFTMLAFSSVSRKMRPTLIKQASEAPYTGIFYHWPAGKAEMDEETARAFENIFAGRGQVLVRRVMQPNEPVLLAGPAPAGQTIDIKGIVGLPKAEEGFLGRMPLIHGRFFSADLAREIILPSSAFEALNIPEEQVGQVKLRMLGEDLTLVGVMDDDRYRFIRDLDPEMPLLPRERTYLWGPQEAADMEDISAMTVDMAALAFLPVKLAGKLGAGPFTVSVHFPEAADGKAAVDFWQEVSTLLDITRAKFFMGSKDAFRPDKEARELVRPGIYYIGSSYRTSIGGLSRLFIPLLIAGSIILNTMLGTVYERKYEIAVYNAVGLNPTHIFMFFLAEAFVYGVLGSVGGYLIGQVMAIALKGFGIVQGVNINFSSLMVAYAIMFTIGLVLLSTVYPAVVATRTAVPSGKRKWSLPAHDGRRMHVVFPFIYQPNLALGVMYYLYEYFSSFTEQSMGDQIATLESLEAGRDADGRQTYSLKYGVALAPFDLGVTQGVFFTTRFDEVVKSYRVHLSITRLSGQDSNWVTTNRPFLEKLRTLLIRWRNIDPTQHSWYVQQGRKLFASAANGAQPQAAAAEGANR